MSNSQLNQFANNLKYIDDNDDIEPTIETSKTHLENLELQNSARFKFNALVEQHSDIRGGGMMYGEDSDERPGMFHNFRQNSRAFPAYDNKKTFGRTTNDEIIINNDSAYDAAFNADDSDIESPRESSSRIKLDRSASSEGTEMKTFCSYEINDGPYHGNYDEVIDVIEDDSDGFSSENKRQFADKRKTRRNYSAVKNSHFTSSSEVDSTVKFNLKSDPDLDLRTSPHLRKSLRSIGRNDDRKLCQSPPFEDPLNLNKMVQSAVDLLPSKSQNPIGTSTLSGLSSSKTDSSSDIQDSFRKTTKKKKKKKPKGDEENTCDENGNPRILNSIPKTMSQGFEELNAQKKGDYRHSLFPNSIPQFSSSGQQSIISDGDNSSAESKSTKPTKKKKQESLVKAGDMPGNCGNKTVEDLLSFIDGSSNNRTTAENTSSSSSSSVGVKNNRKNKDKDKKPNVASTPEKDIHQINDDHPSTKSITDVKTKNNNVNSSGVVEGSVSGVVEGSSSRNSFIAKRCVSEDDQMAIMASLLSDYSSSSSSSAHNDFTVVSKKKKHKIITAKNDKKPTTKSWMVQPFPGKESGAGQAQFNNNTRYQHNRLPASGTDMKSDILVHVVAGAEKCRRNSTGNAPSNDDEFEIVNLQPVATDYPPSRESELRKFVAPKSYATIAASSSSSSPPHSTTADDVSSKSSENDSNEIGEIKCRINDESMKSDATSDTGLLPIACERSESSVIIIKNARPTGSTPPTQRSSRGPTGSTPPTQQSGGVHEKQNVTKKKTTSIRKGKSKDTGVIFLGKNSMEPPRDLGITFGFDFDEDIVETANIGSVIEPTVIEPTQNFQFISNEDFGVKNDDESEIDRHKNEKLALPQINGLYPSLCQPRPINNMDQMKLMRALTTSNSAAEKPTETCENIDNLQIIGSDKSLQSERVDSAAAAAEIQPEIVEENEIVPDPNRINSRGRFNVEDTVFYLMKAFDSVMKEKEKGSTKIVKFSEIMDE
ncbi:uncharacterized protein LOC141899552 [Tubulanus polymorphus]|uniref:uncharacterized protein LOC141899552 n=1 Tax=Tubulanus polymorphus TaxID=672921 RepID=UPI003DA3E572